MCKFAPCLRNSTRAVYDLHICVWLIYPSYPRPTPIWPCSSVGRVTMTGSGGGGFKFHQGQRIFLSLRVGQFPF